MASISWFRISNQLNITTHDVPEISLKSDIKYWLEVVYNNRIHTTGVSRNDFELYDYNVYNNVVDPCQIKELYLTVVKLYDRISNTWGTVVCFEIEDENKHKRKLEFGGCQVDNRKNANEAIIEGISFMKQYGSNKTWEIIDLKIENIRHKYEVECLKENKIFRISN